MSRKKQSSISKTDSSANQKDRTLLYVAVIGVIGTITAAIIAAISGNINIRTQFRLPIMVTQTAQARESTLTVEVQPSDIVVTPLSAGTFVFEDLDADASKWDVFVGSVTQSSTKWVKNNVSSPSIDGRALECWPILSDMAYTNVHCYRKLPLSYNVKAVVLNLSFWFFPSTTCNDQGNPSVVQALEFTISVFRHSARYEFAMQWDNVDEGAPQWRYWANNEWTGVNPPINQCLQGEQWHTFTLQGRIEEGVLYYKSFAIDDQEYSLGLSFVPVSSNEPDFLSIGVQVDGNKIKRPNEFVIDRVSLAITP